VVDLHSRLQAALAADGHDALYRSMFVDDPATACVSCYTLYFASFGPGAGGRGTLVMAWPDPVDSLPTYEALTSIGFAAHEFGHSMHAAIAPTSMIEEDFSALMSQDSSGASVYARLPVNGTIVQAQELGTAFVEGFGMAMGRYFMADCAIPDRAWGEPDPRASMLNPENYRACDPYDAFCPYRLFRFQMTRRGIAEGSAAWKRRLAHLSQLADEAAMAGAIAVTANNEVKIANLFCDLLDNDADVSYAAGQIGGRTYVPDYAWHAWERHGWTHAADRLRDVRIGSAAGNGDAHSRPPPRGDGGFRRFRGRSRSHARSGRRRRERRVGRGAHVDAKPIFRAVAGSLSRHGGRGDARRDERHTPGQPDGGASVACSPAQTRRGKMQTTNRSTWRTLFSAMAVRGCAAAIALLAVSLPALAQSPAPPSTAADGELQFRRRALSPRCARAARGLRQQKRTGAFENCLAEDRGLAYSAFRPEDRMG
jgi:hypothetical protein